MWGEWHTEFSGADKSLGDITRLQHVDNDERVITTGLFSGETYAKRVELRRFVAEELLRIPTKTIRVDGEEQQVPDLVHDIKRHTVAPADPPVLRERDPVPAAKFAQKPRARRSKRQAEQEYEVKEFICRPKPGLIKVLWTAGDTTIQTVKELKRDLDARTYNRLARGIRDC